MKKLRRILKSLGPGFITGASDDDPSGIGTYAQTGAAFGLQQLWTAPFSFPFMAAVQEMCGRIGLVTGSGLAGVIRRHYQKSILYVAVGILLVANTVNIGADLGAMAAAARLVVDLPLVFWLVSITLLSLVLEVFVSYRLYARVLKYLTFSLLTYVVTAFIVTQDWRAALVATLVPTVVASREYVLNVVAILGTTISPYLFFWQASEEVEEEVLRHKITSMGAGVPRISQKEIRELRLDTLTGMLFSNVIMFFIILTTASTLGLHGIRDVATADQAAAALRPLAGTFASLLFAIGIIGTGLLAIPVLAGSASYALSEAFGWREGLYRKFQQAHGFYGVITIATVIGLLMNFTSIPPMKLLYYSAVLNGIAAPPLLVIILFIANNRRIMGAYTNSRFSNVLGVAITVLMSFVSLLLIGNFIF